MRFHFESFTLDSSTRLLLKGQDVVRISPKAFQLLLALLEYAPNALSKQEIQERIWPDTFVTETNLPTLVSEIRTALEDDSREPRFVRTVYGFGYAFSGELRRDDALTAAPQTPGKARPFRWHLLSLAMLSLVALVVGVALVWRYTHVRPVHEPGQSVAVLPLANVSGDPKQDYFAEGMTEELTTQLAEISHLRVMSSSSVAGYIKGKMSVREIGKELNVSSVVTGTVLRSGERVRITARLIDAATERTLWAADYEQEFRDILTLQNEVARTIAETIEVTLSDRELGRLSAGRAIDPEAHDQYLKARYAASQLTADGLSTALEYYRRAIEIDPAYARAWAGLADCYNWLGFYGMLVPADAYPNARRAALNAIKNDPNLTEAAVSLAAVHSAYDWNQAAAEAEFRRAVATNPNYPDGHQLFGLQLLAEGKIDDAVKEINHALTLDPRSRPFNTELGWILYLGRRYTAAITQYERTLQIDSREPQVWEGLADVYAAQGDDRRAFATYQQWEKVAKFDADTISALDDAYAHRGMPGYWQKRLELEESESAESGNVWSFRMASLHARLGHRSETLLWLEKSLAERNMRIIYLGVYPMFDFLRGDPAFVDLERRARISFREQISAR